MRILYLLTRGDTIGGASIHVRDMARRLLSEGHYVLVVVGQGAQVTEALRDADVPYRQIDTMRRSIHPLKDGITLIRLIREIRRFQPDLVSCHTAKAGALGRVAARLTGTRSIYSPHCWSFVDDFPRAKLYLRVEKCLSSFTDQVVAVSEYERQQGIESGVCRAGNSLTIHNGMPDVASKPADPRKDPPRLTMVARFDEQKNHRSLMDALSELVEQPWHLDLVGDGPLRPSIEAQADALGLRDRVSFHGYSSDVTELLQKSQIFVLSTLWESFPRSILEAMRAGLPIVASDVGGCDESVLDSVNGVLVPPKDAQALAATLERLIDNPKIRTEMGQASRRRYEHYFNFDRMYANYLDLYAKMTAKKTRSSKTITHRGLVGRKQKRR